LQPKQHAHALELVAIEISTARPSLRQLLLRLVGSSF
jgi:hypothetical protein